VQIIKIRNKKADGLKDVELVTMNTFVLSTETKDEKFLSTKVPSAIIISGDLCEQVPTGKYHDSC